jgi:hypothetical protein
MQLDLFDKVEGRITRHTPEGFVLTLYLDAGHRAKIMTRLQQLVHRGASSTGQRRDFRLVPKAGACCVVFADGTSHDVKIIDVSRSGVALGAPSVRQSAAGCPRGRARRPSCAISGMGLPSNSTSAFHRQLSTRTSSSDQ